MDIGQRLGTGSHLSTSCILDKRGGNVHTQTHSMRETQIKQSAESRWQGQVVHKQKALSQKAAIISPHLIPSSSCSPKQPPTHPHTHTHTQLQTIATQHWVQRPPQTECPDLVRWNAKHGTCLALSGAFLDYRTRSEEANILESLRDSQDQQPVAGHTHTHTHTHTHRRCSYTRIHRGATCLT